MSYKEELVDCAEHKREEGRKKLVSSIQEHALNQLKNGYTSFRIMNLCKSNEVYLAQWANDSEADIRLVKFRCYKDNKIYLIKQYDVDLSRLINAAYKKEGNCLILKK